MYGISGADEYFSSEDQFNGTFKLINWIIFCKKNILNQKIKYKTALIFFEKNANLFIQKIFSGR